MYMSRRSLHPAALYIYASLIFILFSSPLARGATLKQQTISAWDSYLKQMQARVDQRTHGPAPFLWVDAAPDAALRVRGGQILVAPYGHGPKRVPGGLIHHWIGAVFIPGARTEDVLKIIRDYPEYKQFYRPTVVDSSLITGPSAPAGAEDRFSVRFLNRAVLSKIAFDADYTASYVQLGPGTWYGVGYTTRLRELRKYGESEQCEMPADAGHGYIWRLYAVTRLVGKDGGVYMEVEAVALSRDIPVSLRWAAAPIVRRVSRDALTTSLGQTRDAVRSAMAQESREAAITQTVRSVAVNSPAAAHSR